MDELTKEFGMVRAVEPTYTTSRFHLATCCWAKFLLMTNRAALYQLVVDAVASMTDPSKTMETMLSTKIPFRRIGIAGDGRCGWRSLIAAEDAEAYRTVPRTGRWRKHTWVIIYALAQAFTSICAVCYLYTCGS